MTENREASQRQYLELDAPEFLEQGQNLFDQPPFDVTCDRLVEGCSVDLDIARRALGALVAPKFSSSGVSPTPTAGFSGFDAQRQHTILEIYRNRMLSQIGLRRSEFSSAQAGTATGIIFENLKPFPYWGEYIGINIIVGEYKENGVWRVKNTYVPVETYALWVTNRLRAELNSVLWGIEDAFPEHPPTLKRARVRRWRVMEASELAKRKK